MSYQVKIAFVCSALAPVLSVSACARGEHKTSPRTPRVDGPVIAQINNSSITLHDLDHWATLTRPLRRSNRMFTRDRLLGFLIRSKWLLLEAEQLGVSVPARAVKEEAQELVEDEAEDAPFAHLPHDAELRTLLLLRALGRADREMLVRLVLLLPKVERARLARAREQVEHREVAHFYAMNSRHFYLPHQRQVEIIGSTLADVVEAKREIEGGKPFLEVARRVSRDPEAPGGLWRLLQGHDEPQVEHEVFAAKLHTLVGPKKYSEFYIFRVLEDIPAHQETIAEAEAEVRKRLAPSRERLALQSERYWVSRTKCHGGYSTRRCTAKSL